MASAKHKASAKSSVKFKDLKSKKNPKGGSSGGDRPTISWSGGGGGDVPTESQKF
jgi:hypothetical protein